MATSSWRLAIERRWPGRRLAALALFTVSGCGRTDGSAATKGFEETPAGGSSAPLLVYTVNYPLAYFAERIGDEFVNVRFPAPPGVDPARWSPDVETISAYQAADLILLNGAGYAAWVDRASLPASRLVVTTRGVRDRFILVDDAVTHSHGPEGEHAHGRIASATWLDIGLAVEQARAIRDAFVAARPDSVAGFDTRFRELERDLIDLDQEIAALVSAGPRLPLLSAGPIYPYLAARYGLSLQTAPFEPGERPSASDWRVLGSILAEHPARWMIWETEPLPETAARLRELGIEGLVFDPAANRPMTGDYLSVMRENVSGLKRVFSSS